VLYESELDDNGISSLTVKLRVMEQRMLLLCRLFMRVDGVLVRVRDTRVYVDFARDEVIREYTAKETSFDQVKKVSRFRARDGELILVRF
jgi:type 2A phosphatase activator TIP41